MRVIRVVAAWAGVLAIAACGGVNSAGSKKAGGTVNATVLPGIGSTITGEFWSDVTGGKFKVADPNAYIPMGGCVAAAPAVVDTRLTFTYLDVGSSLTLSRTGGAPAVATQTVNGAQITYGFFGSATALTAGQTYDIVLKGHGSIPAQTWAGEMKIPKLPVLSKPAGFSGGNITFANGPVDVAWTPMGGTAVILTLEDISGAGQSCRTQDDGSFQIPAPAIGQIPATGALLVESYHFGTHTLNGRSVEIVGATVAGAGYTKN